MRTFKIYCQKCGWEGERLESEMYLPNECPICNAKGSLSIKEEELHKITEVLIEDNVRDGLKNFGIEKTLELISESKLISQSLYEEYLRVLEMSYPKLYKIVKECKLEKEE